MCVHVPWHMRSEDSYGDRLSLCTLGSRYLTQAVKFAQQVFSPAKPSCQPIMYILEQDFWGFRFCFLQMSANVFIVFPWLSVLLKGMVTIIVTSSLKWLHICKAQLSVCKCYCVIATFGNLLSFSSNALRDGRKVKLLVPQCAAFRFPLGSSQNEV